MKLFCKPKALIHYSTVPVTDFAQRHFKVNTQGRVYTLDLFKHSRYATTSAIAPKSALVFTGKALEKFKPHPLATLLFFKSFLGQYWTRAVGDVTWTPADETAHGDVLHITDIQIIPVVGIGRKCRQYTKIFLRYLGEIFPFALVAGGYLLVHSDMNTAIESHINQYITLYKAGFWLFISCLGVSMIFALVQQAKRWGTVAAPFQVDLQALGLVGSNPVYAPDTDCFGYKTIALCKRAVGWVRSLWS
ncbi:hypothetical protein CJF43_21290 [Pseudomonas fragi]|uniref:Uncharacterized protein n=1 Tax=Pseudomonas fragi TaxID=296 RepID=A0A266LR18_PSEFR|nr:hypothetical protein CJF43_21290 [Pseudomonas fragi]